MERWTKRMLLLLLAIAGVNIILYGTTMKESEGENVRYRVEAGGLVCEDAVWRFGEINPAVSSRLTHRFTLKNETQKTVRIEEVKSSCGCMVAAGYDKELAPGASTGVEIAIKLPPTPGPFSKDSSVLIAGNPPAILPLRAVGTVKPNPSMHTAPERLNFGTIKPGELKERSFQVVRYEFSPIRFINAVGNSPALTCIPKNQPKEDDGKVELLATLKGEGLPPGAYRGSITVNTYGNKDCSKLLVPVQVVVEE